MEQAAATQAYRALRSAKKNLTMFQAHLAQVEITDADQAKLARLKAEVELLEARADAADDLNLECSNKNADARRELAKNVV